MSNNCECDKPVVKIPLRGLELALDSEALGNFGGMVSTIHLKNNGQENTGLMEKRFTKKHTA